MRIKDLKIANDFDSDREVKIEIGECDTGSPMWLTRSDLLSLKVHITELLGGNTTDTLDDALAIMKAHGVKSLEVA